MFISRFCAAIAGVILLAPFFAYSGNLDSPAAPTETGSAMYTVSDIYNRLDTGSATAKRTGAFSEPTAGPTAGTGRTYDEVMAKAPSMDNTNGASASHVLFGKTFWGLTSAGWGTQTGSLATQTLSDTSTTVTAGYYAATTLNAVDADLATGNIKSGVSIFGVAGSSTVNSTSGVTAAAGDMLLNKTAYVNGAVVTGTIVTQTLAAGTTTVNGGYYAATSLDAVDADLATGNIKSGVAVFGVAGSTNVVDTTSGDAVAGDILSGKKAYAGGSLVTGNIATQALANTSTTVSAGYYAATTLNAVDTDLATGNIKSGVNIFGVAGSTNVVDTTSGDAASGDILSGKIAYVGGGTVTGNIATRTLSNGTTTVSAGYYAATDLATVDTDLAADSIISGKTIFGIAGSATVSNVPKTGQTTSYTTTAGEDGDLQKGVAWPTPRFTDNGNGTVTDNLTGLIWLKNANAFANRTWEQALAVANALAHGSSGLTDGSVVGDWRLPNRCELESLLDFAYNAPTLSNALGTGKWSNGSAFIGVQSTRYWSSTTYSGHTLYAWTVSLGDAHVSFINKDITGEVLPVRAGP